MLIASAEPLGLVRVGRSPWLDEEGEGWYRVESQEGPMIRKTASGYQVVSEEGKPLSRDDLTLEQAKRRLAQVEVFKRADAH